MTLQNRLTRAAGPLLPVLAFFLSSLVFLSLARLGLIAWKWDRVSAVSGLWPVLGYGVRMDVLLLSMVSSLPALASLVLPSSGRARRLWRAVQGAWFAGFACLFVFMEAATPFFIDQFDSRPNRLFFEYLDHPFEIFWTLWGAYKPAVLLGPGLIILTAWGVWKVSLKLTEASLPWSSWRRLALLPLVALLLFAGARSSLGHRPANMSTAAFCGDALVNQLGLSSAYSLASALYRMRDESGSVSFYGRMPEDEVIGRVRGEMGLPPSAFTDPGAPTLHRQVPKFRRARPLNLVIILEESLGARYVASLGGLPLTPELEKLSRTGLWFSSLYATGTRSVRGIEAVVTGFPPTPARSVVKLGLSQHNFFTLARLLKDQGYATEFIYGGDSRFDNMRGFLLGNGFERVVDEQNFSGPVFHGSWGVSDEDIFNRTHKELLAHGDEPFFTFVFTVSNHSPFEFPDGRIDLRGTPRNTPENAIRYADYALGRFFRQARKAPYWDRTVFLVVADHEDRVGGEGLVPVGLFHVPALILGADVGQGRSDKVASQMDLAPTLLSFMGIESSHPMQGRDLLRTPADYPGRAIMQFHNNHAYMVGDKVVVHTPGKPAVQYRYRQGRLEPVEAEPELVRDALAQAIWPVIAYREKRYRLAAGSPGPQTAKRKAAAPGTGRSG